MRILFVSTGYPTVENPNHCVFIHRSVQALLPYIEIHVVHFRAWLPGRPLVEKRKWEGVNVTTIYCPQSPSISHFYANTQFLSIIGKFVFGASIELYDLIHSTDIYPAGYIAQNWARQYGKPHTSHVIGSDVNYFLTSNLPRVGTDWMFNIKGFICNSCDIMQRLLDLVPGLKNLQVVNRGVDITFFSPEGYASGPQVALPPVRFLFLGGFHSADPKNPLYNLKGGPLLQDAWQSVEERISPSSLLVGGPGTNIPHLEKWRANLKRPEAVFLSHAIIPNNMPSLLRACDVLIVPSMNEGLPNIANEAQACGRAVLGSDAGGIPESVIDGETGRIVKRGNAEALANGIKWFFSNRSDILEMGQRGRSRVSKKYSWDVFAQKVISFFYDIL